MSVLKLPEVEEAVNSTRMIHLTLECCWPAKFRGICGAKLQGVARPETPLDCVICAEMANSPVRCRYCSTIS